MFGFNKKQEKTEKQYLLELTDGQLEKIRDPQLTNAVHSERLELAMPYLVRMNEAKSKEIEFVATDILFSLFDILWYRPDNLTYNFNEYDLMMNPELSHYFQEWKRHKLND